MKVHRLTVDLRRVRAGWSAVGETGIPGVTVECCLLYTSVADFGLAAVDQPVVEAAHVLGLAENQLIGVTVLHHLVEQGPHLLCLALRLFSNSSTDVESSSSCFLKSTTLVCFAALSLSI